MDDAAAVDHQYKDGELWRVQLRRMQINHLAVVATKTKVTGV
jgi:hypothetical protein